MKPIINYYENLKKQGVELSPRDKEHLAQAYRILGVAAFSDLSEEDVVFDPKKTDTFEAYELFEE